MHGMLRIVATLLLSLAVALPGAQAMQLPATPAGHAAGCHGPGPASPSHVPSRYQCCVNGHDAAAPTVPFAASFAAARVASLDQGDELYLSSRPCLNSAVFVFPSNSPPGAALLRI